VNPAGDELNSGNQGAANICIDGCFFFLAFFTFLLFVAGWIILIGGEIFFVGFLASLNAKGHLPFFPLPVLGRFFRFSPAIRLLAALLDFLRGAVRASVVFQEAIFFFLFPLYACDDFPQQLVYQPLFFESGWWPPPRSLPPFLPVGKTPGGRWSLTFFSFGCPWDWNPLFFLAPLIQYSSYDFPLLLMPVRPFFSLCGDFPPPRCETLSAI